MDNLGDRIAEIFARNAERDFIVDGIRNRKFTYGEVLRLALSGAASLRANGVRSGDRLGLDLSNGAEFAILYFSCLLGGITAVPLNNALPKKDRDFILQKSKLGALACAAPSPDAGRVSQMPAFCPTIHVPLIDAADSSTNDGPPSLRWTDGGGGDFGDILRSQAEAVFSMTFTSGTTNLPKGVLHSVRCLLSNADSFNRKFGLEGARFLHVMPMAYMAGFLNTLLCPFMAQGSVVLAPQFSATSVLRFWDPVLQFEANMVWMAPTMLATLMKVDRDPRGRQYCQSGRLRIFSATAPLPVKVRSEFESRYGTAVVESYGLSELLLISANTGPSGQKDRSVGVTLPEVTCEARDAVGSRLVTGIEGEIFVKTPFRMLGYLDYATGDVLPPETEWTATGDIGCIDGDGYVFITGRAKDLVIRGGYNVSPRSVEELLLQHPAVDDAAVFGVPHDFYGEELVAAVILNEGFVIEKVRKDLAEMCRLQLGPSMVPDRIIELETFPVSTTGKVQKHLLKRAQGVASA